jgi:hypothetical protein
MSDPKQSIPNDLSKNYIDTKLAEKILKRFGKSKESVCEHDLPFFACMACSH